MAVYRLCIRPDAKGKGTEVIIQRRHWLPFLWQDWGSVEDAERQLKREAFSIVNRLKQLATDIVVASKDKERAIQDAVQNGTRRGIGKPYVGKDTPRCYPEPPISEDDWKPIKAILDSLSGGGGPRRGSDTTETTAYYLKGQGQLDKFKREYHAKHGSFIDGELEFRPPPPSKDGKKQQQQQHKGGPPPGE